MVVSIFYSVKKTKIKCIINRVIFFPCEPEKGLLKSKSFPKRSELETFLMGKKMSTGCPEVMAVTTTDCS